MNTTMHDTDRLPNSPHTALSKLFFILAILNSAGAAWILLTPLSVGLLRNLFDHMVDTTAASVVAQLVNMTSLFVSYGISIAANVFYIFASKYMENATHQKLLRIGGIVSAATLGIYLVYMLISSAYSVLYYTAGTDISGMAELLYAVSGGRTWIVTFLALLMPVGNILCALCFMKHEQRNIRVPAIVLLACIGTSLLLNLLPFGYAMVFNWIKAVVAFGAKIILAVFFIMVSKFYRTKE